MARTPTLLASHVSRPRKKRQFVDSMRVDETRLLLARMCRLTPFSGSLLHVGD